ncbi:ABC-type nitrate/sulfonate/bicarbonate transport system, permease component [uncultured Sporomusa sp.]|uniref:ABC-type nitrate/sulfonate/bicarbonate transport system, permease component n=1 Tax=uncultured Sporomusa sp. TaxID=307249 RepID=A0A212LVB9_9FIRM|nr:ABC transporter permease subunit [uncultured Sporomusa sp.]SCM81349.1 ABC-type nitrate/sulfonate/bicarbonate transport system, permease component [uncultured Sporomusa sp.]
MDGLKRFFQNYSGTVLILATAFGLYELVTDGLGLLSQVLFPGFSKIGPRLVSSLPKLIDCFFSSMYLLIPTYIVGAVSGMLLGIIIGLRPRLHKSLKPIIFGLSPLPPSMLTPYFIAVMPTFYLSSCGVIFIGVFWPILSGTINGITMIEQKYLDNAKVLGFTGWKLLFYIIIPAAAPMIFAGMGTALNFAFILLGIAEMFATTSGLGYYIQYYADFSDYARVLAGLLFTTVVIVSIMVLFDRIKKKTLFWTINKDMG